MGCGTSSRMQSWRFPFFGIAYLDDSITDCKEQDIRLMGLLFQIVGFAIVVRQLNARRRLFRKPSFFLRTQTFLKRFPSPFSKTIDLSPGPMSAEVGISKAELTLRPGPDASLDTRMELLEREIDGLRQRLRETDKYLGDHQAESKRSLDEIRERIESGHNELRRLIDEAVAGDLNLERIGILYFVAGVCLATASSEISIYLGYVGQCSLSAQ